MIRIITSGTLNLTTSSWDNIVNRCVSKPYVIFNDNVAGQPSYNTTNKQFENLSGNTGYTYSTWIATKAGSAAAVNHAFRLIATGTFGTSSIAAWTSTVSGTTSVGGSAESGFIMTPSGTTGLIFEHCASGTAAATTALTIAGQACQTYSFTLGKR